MNTNCRRQGPYGAYDFQICGLFKKGCGAVWRKEYNRYSFVCPVSEGKKHIPLRIQGRQGRNGRIFFQRIRDKYTAYKENRIQRTFFGGFSCGLQERGQIFKRVKKVSLTEEAQKPQKWLFDGEKVEISPKGTELTADKAECVLKVMSDDFLKLSDEGICIEEKLKIAENMGMSALTSH